MNQPWPGHALKPLFILLLAGGLLEGLIYVTESLLLPRLLQVALLISIISFYGLWKPVGLMLPKQEQWFFAVKVAFWAILSFALMIYFSDILEYIPLPEHVTAQGVMIFLCLAPLVEEILFRAALYGVLRQVMNGWFAILVSALCFAFAHGDGWLPALIGGVIFAYIYEQTRNLLLPILLHSGANAAVLALAVLIERW